MALGNYTGFIKDDPKLETLPTGRPVVNLVLGQLPYSKEIRENAKAKGEHLPAKFTKCCFYGKLAEEVMNYHKNDCIDIYGSSQAVAYLDKDTKAPRASQYVVVHNFSKHVSKQLEDVEPEIRGELIEEEVIEQEPEQEAALSLE